MSCDIQALRGRQLLLILATQGWGIQAIAKESGISSWTLTELRSGSDIPRLPRDLEKLTLAYFRCLEKEAAGKSPVRVKAWAKRRGLMS